MSGFQNMKKQLGVVLRGIPIIILCLLLALLFAAKIILYTNTTYQSIAKVKLDDSKYGFSSTAMFEDFDVFSSEKYIETEAEILNSPLLVGMAVDSLDFDIAIYRAGSIKKTLLYDNSPITVTYHFEKPELYKKEYGLVIKGDSVTLKVGKEENATTYKSFLGEKFELEGGEIIVFKRELVDKNIVRDGAYNVKFFDRESLIKDVKSRLDVKAVSKEIFVLRVVYTDESAVRAAKFTNRLCQVYVDDYIASKASAANTSVNFIKSQLEEVRQKLERAELELKLFKEQNDVVNTLQETETGLREISKLKIQLINLSINKQSVDQLEAYIAEGNFFDETSVSFGFGDLLMTELVKKMQILIGERKDLLALYTEDHEKVVAHDEKIAEIKNYIKEAIKSNKKEIATKITEAEEALKIAEVQFKHFPQREKDLKILEREFRLQESSYNFLSEKLIEASIAASVKTAFHRVIQKAVVEKKAVKPNKTLITFVFGLLGLIIGIIIVYFRAAIVKKIIDKVDIEKTSLTPIVALVRRRKESMVNSEFITIAKGLLLKGFVNKKDKNVLTIVSAVEGEGKSFITRNLGTALVEMGYNVALVDLDMERPSLQTGVKKFNYLNAVDETTQLEEGITLYSTLNKDNSFLNNVEHVLEKIAILKEKYDFVVIDGGSIKESISAIELMKESSVSLFVVRANYTYFKYATFPDILKEEYGVDNIQFLLNDISSSINYTGYFSNYNLSLKHLYYRLKHYYNAK